MSVRPRIGLSACFFHSDPKRAVFKGKTLLYTEESLAHWVFRCGGLPYVVPTPPEGNLIQDQVQDLDGLLLVGGSDVSPHSYGQSAMKPEWEGDYIRDQYEIALIREFVRQKKPVFGVCRGMQILNVAFGGTLYQDISSQVPGAFVHRAWEIYDQNQHDIVLEDNSLLEKLCGLQNSRRVNSVHHQGIDTLAKGFLVEAKSKPDHIIEAIRFTEEPFVYGVQWHPEFQTWKDDSWFQIEPLVSVFIQECQKGLHHA